MERLKMQTQNKADENFYKLAEMFPNAITETIDENGDVVRAIDKDVLMQEINVKVVEGKDERYQFTWPDKKKTILNFNQSSNMTLRPLVDKSINFYDTRNLYIEGDNSDVLKLLKESYEKEIKFIYIDPPYNTGTNILYKNDFSESVESYLSRTGQVDIDNNRLIKNTERNGRFHTDWLNMIYPSLRFAKDLLKNDGYIAIAIDDHELYNLKKICDEIFSENNYIGTIVTRSNPQGRDKKNLDPQHEYHLLYAKNINDMPELRIKKDIDDIENDENDENKDKKQKNSYLMRSGTNSRKNERPNRFYPILFKDGKLSMIKKEEFNKIYSKVNGFDEDYLLSLKNKYESLGYTYILPIAENGEEKVWQRVFDRVSKEIDTYIFENGKIKTPPRDDRVPTSLWIKKKHSNVSNGTNKLKQLFETDKIPFDFSKSIFTVKDLISLNTSDDDIILDFFPGSATTAHATLLLNSEDKCNRKFILVQLPEPIDEKNNHLSEEYKTIADIGRKRIELAGKELANYEIDTGFRTLKIDSSNMKDVYYNPSEYNTDLFDSLENNIKEDRTPEDLLFQVMIDLGILLSSNIEETCISGKKVFNVDDNYLIACFDNNITEDVIVEIAKQEPYYFVLRDASLASDSVATNFEQIFATYSPDTVRKVL